MKRNRGPALRDACGGAALVLACATAGATAASRHVQAELVSEVESIRPGQPFRVGLRLKMAPEWHTYWKNPGDSGLPTRIAWRLPDGFQAGPIEWPYPKPFSQGPVTSYGYEGEVLLPVLLTPPASLAPGRPVTIAARADWLECKEACLPGRAELSVVVPVAAHPPRPAAAWTAAFGEARRGLPVEPAGWTFEARETPAGFQLILRPPKAWGPLRQVYFFPEKPALLDHAAPQKLAPMGAGYQLELTPAANAARPLAALTGVLVVQGVGGEARALRVDTPATRKKEGQ